MLVHWDEVDEERREVGELRSARQRLGAAAGAVEVGLSRWRIPAGHRNAPAHVHADEEEIFHVLGGRGLSWEDERAYPVGPGDTIVHRIGEAAHTLFGELDVLAFGEGSLTSLTWLPRANVMWAAPRWLPLDGAHPYEAEVAAGPLIAPEPTMPRPPHIVALEDVAATPTQRGRTDSLRRDLGTAGGARRSGLKHITIAANAESHPPHCHSEEEELFVVLGGEGALLLGETEAHPVRRGSVVSRPPGTGIAHTFAAGPDGLELLAYGQRRTSDLCFYPRSGKVSLRGLDVVFRVEPLDYWDGEE